MLLQPRKFKYKTRQKRRSAKIPRLAKFTYGSMGLFLLKPFRISAKKIFRLKLFLKRSSRKSDITKRAFWIPIFPHLPLSKKPKGIRMGKGAGKLSTWYTQIRGGTALVEFKNLRLGRARYYSNQVSHKLPIPAVFWTKPTRDIKINCAKRLNPSLLSFW